MRSIHLLAVASMATALLLGCEKKQETTAPAGAVEEGKVETASGEASASADKVAKELEPLIDKAVQAIKDGKLDDAEKALKSLEAKKSDAPAPTQKQIDDLRTSFDAAKAAEGAKSNLPKL